MATNTVTTTGLVHTNDSSSVALKMATLTDEEWDAYKRKHEKSYADAAEDEMRRDLVAKCKQFVEDHNKKFEAGEVTFTCGLNHFSDFTEEENKNMFGRRMPIDPEQSDT